jgi:cell division protein FtsW (lipid II flippase)
VKVTLLQIKVVHTVIFWVLSLCVVYALYSGVSGRVGAWTWVAVGLLVVESVVLIASGWTCPLTLLAERQGAAQGSVADIFLPKWLADRIFAICGSAFGVALVLIVWRVLR